MAKGKKSLSVRNREVQVELDALERKLKGWGEVGMWLPEKERQRYLRWIDGLREELARAVIEKDEKRFSYLVRHDFSALRKELKAKEKEIKRMVKKLRWLLKDIDRRPDAYLSLAGVYNSGWLVVPTAKMKLVLRMKGIPYEWWEVPAFKNDVAGKLRDWYRYRRTLIKEVAAKYKARSERARSMDARRKAKKVIDVRKATIKELERYLKNPNRYDIKGLDTPQPKKKEKKKAKKKAVLKAVGKELGGVTVKELKSGFQVKVGKNRFKVFQEVAKWYPHGRRYYDSTGKGRRLLYVVAIKPPKNASGEVREALKAIADKFEDTQMYKLVNVDTPASLYNTYVYQVRREKEFSKGELGKLAEKIGKEILKELKEIEKARA